MIIAEDASLTSQTDAASLKQLIINRPSSSPLCLALSEIPTFDQFIYHLSKDLAFKKDLDSSEEYPPEYLEGLRIVGQNKEIQNEADYFQFLRKNENFNFAVLEVKFRCVGGKGGFGSLLRSSKSTKRTTNFGSCRDIHGRRLRDTDKERLLSELKHQQELREHERVELEKARAKEKRLEMDAGLEEVKRAEEEIQAKRKQAVEHINTSVQKAITKKKEEEKKRKRDPEEEKYESESESESGPKLKKQRVDPQSPSNTQTHLSSPSTITNTSLQQQTQTPVPSVEKEPPSHVPSISEETVDLNTINSLSELEQVGTETIKRTLIKLGLKCGGTPKDRLNRLWSVKGLAPHMIPAKLKAKGKK